MARDIAARIEATIGLITQTDGLTAVYEGATDTLIIGWADQPGAATTRLLRASTATVADVRATVRQFIYA